MLEGSLCSNILFLKKIFFFSLQLYTVQSNYYMISPHNIVNFFLNFFHYNGIPVIKSIANFLIYIDHFLKFLTKELAAKATIEGDRVILNMKVSSKKINPKIEQYVDEFVLCRECKKPDTELVKEGKFTLIRCLACGAKHPIRSKI